MLTELPLAALAGNPAGSNPRQSCKTLSTPLPALPHLTVHVSLATYALRFLSAETPSPRRFLSRRSRQPSFAQGRSRKERWNCDANPPIRLLLRERRLRLGGAGVFTRPQPSHPESGTRRLSHSTGRITRACPSWAYAQVHTRAQTHTACATHFPVENRAWTSYESKKQKTKERTIVQSSPSLRHLRSHQVRAQRRRGPPDRVPSVLQRPLSVLLPQTRYCNGNAMRRQAPTHQRTRLGWASILHY